MKIKTLNRLETHDRLLEFMKGDDYISKGCEDCIKNRPEEFGNIPFYIFAHPRTDDDGFTKRLIWAPRLTKPKAQTNSMLFKVYPPDNIRIIWMIPPREMWDTYKPGQITHSNTIWESITSFETARETLERPENDDLPEEKIQNLYLEIAKNAKYRKSHIDLSLSQ